MSPVTFYIQSETKGQQAYEQANKIAEKLENYMKDKFTEEWETSNET